MPFLSPNQQHKNTKGTDSVHKSRNAYKNALHLSLAFLFAKNPTKLRLLNGYRLTDYR